jgi:hypothetical protein
VPKWAEVIEHRVQPSSPIVDWVALSMAGDESYRLWEAARVESAAPNGEIYLTSTVGDMLIGGSFEFEDAGGHELKGIDGVWALRRLV